MSGANQHVSISATESAKEYNERESRKRTRDEVEADVEVDKRPFTIQVMVVVTMGV